MASEADPRPTQHGVSLHDAQRAAIAVVDARTKAAQKPPTSAYEFEISHDRDLRQYGAVLNGHEIGRLDYTLTGIRIVLSNTVIVSSFQHHGNATELIGRVLDDVRTTGKTITVLCPVVRAFIDRYPQYADLLDHAHPGVPSTI